MSKTSEAFLALQEQDDAELMTAWPTPAAPIAAPQPAPAALNLPF